MRAGSIKKGGKVRHSIIKDPYGAFSNYQLNCGAGFLYYAEQLDFKSTKPPCKNCVNVDRLKLGVAKRNLARLGVK